MATFKEPLSGGLVTSKQPNELAPGELSLAANLYYSPFSDGLHRAEARTAATAAPSASAITGLASAAFDFIGVNSNITSGSTAVTVISQDVQTVTTTSGSPTITASATGATFIGIFPGAQVSGTGITNGTTVLTVVSNIQLVLSANATATGTPTLTFINPSFRLVTVGAKVTGQGIPDGTTVSAITTNFALTLSAAATLTTASRLTIAADDVIVEQVNGTYRSAKIGSTGTSLTFTTLESVSEGASLEAIHYNNQHVLLNGKNVNRVLKADGNLRPHGLAPVTEAPNVAVVAGQWGLVSGAGFYAYWTTEYDKVHDLESDFSLGPDNDGRPVRPPIAQIITVGSQAISITRPERTNPTATHWRVYRSKKLVSTTLQSAKNEDVYPDGVLVAQVELRDDVAATRTILDGGLVAGVSTTAAVTAGAVGLVGVGAAGQTWATPSNATGAINSTYAVLTGVGVVPRLDKVMLQLTTFTIPTVTAPVDGITITVRGKRVNSGIGASSLSVVPVKGGLSFSDVAAILTALKNAQVVPLTTSDSTITIGSVSDLWGTKWDPSDFVNGRFSLLFFGVATNSNSVVHIDNCSVAVAYGETQGGAVGTFEAIGDDYPAVVVSPFGFSVAAGRGGQPPTATTGDIFQDSLLLNNVNDDSILQYSFPTRIDAFPAPYFLNFDTKYQDKITLIRSIGNVAIVGLLHQIFRINYLPRDSDAEFDRQRAVERIDSDFGIPGNKCATIFTLPGVGQVLAFANNYGMFLTDGYRIRPLTTDLNWPALIRTTTIGSAVLINDPELQVLKLYYNPVDGADSITLNNTLVFHYAPQHLKQGPAGMELKVTGPWATAVTTYDNIRSADTVTLPNGTKKVYLGFSDGHVRYENSAKAAGTPLFRTREMYSAAEGKEWRSLKGWVDYTQRDYNDVSPGTVSIQPYVRKSDAILRAGSTKTGAIPDFPTGGSINPQQQFHHKLVPADGGEAVAFEVSAAIAGTERHSFNFLVIEGDDLGPENST